MGKGRWTIFSIGKGKNAGRRPEFLNTLPKCYKLGARPYMLNSDPTSPKLLSENCALNLCSDFVRDGYGVVKNCQWSLIGMIMSIAEDN